MKRWPTTRCECVTCCRPVRITHRPDFHLDDYCPDCGEQHYVHVDTDGNLRDLQGIETTR